MGIEHVAVTPPKQNFESTTKSKQPFTYNIAQRPLNPCNATGLGNPSQLAGHLPGSESPRRNRIAPQKTPQEIS